MSDIALNPTQVTQTDWVLQELASGVLFHFNGDLKELAPAFAALMKVDEAELLWAMEEHGVCETEDWSLQDARPMGPANLN